MAVKGYSVWDARDLLIFLKSHLSKTDNTATDLDPVREESAGAVAAGEELPHVLLPDQAEAVPQALLLWE